MKGVIFTDTSYFQTHLSDAYPHPWVSFRACDGTFRDPAFSANHAWAVHAAKTGKIVGYTVYCVYRPGIDVVDVVRSMVGTPDVYVTVMLDIESWGGKIRGNRSTEITTIAERFAAWLGDKRRVLAYGNQYDLANLYPHRPDWLRLVVAGYSATKPNVANMVGWQYSDGQAKWSRPVGLPRSTPPFGPCDHNIFPGVTAAQLPALLGVGAHANPSAPTAPTGDDDMPQLVQDKKTGRRFVLSALTPPRYMTKYEAAAFARLHGLTGTPRPVEHNDLVNWDWRTRHPKGL